MPNPQAAKLISDNLHDLTHPDGTALRDNQLAGDPSLPQQWRDDVAKLKQGRAEAIVHLIESNGGQVVMPGDVEAPPPPPAQWVEVHCRACGNVIQKINLVQPDVGHARYLIQNMSALDPECPHHALAPRQ
jgi:hypothetical protein